MPDTPNPSSIAPTHALFVALVLALAILFYAAAWLGVATWFEGFHGWLALLATPTIMVLLRLLRVPAGTPRSALATFATAIAIAFANWLVIALPIANAMGLTPLAAALHIGPHFAWTLLALTHTMLDWAWVVLALAMAAWSGYHDDDVSGRRRPAP